MFVHSDVLLRSWTDTLDSLHEHVAKVHLSSPVRLRQKIVEWPILRAPFASSMWGRDLKLHRSRCRFGAQDDARLFRGCWA